MNLSITDFLMWRACPYKANTLISRGLGGRSTRALSVGTALHKHMEWILLGRNGDPPEVPLEDEEETRPLIESVKDWTPPFSVIAVEAQMGMAINPAHNAVGTFDALVTDSDRHPGTWSLQWKTIAASRRLDLELERVRMSPHEILYHVLAAANGIKLEGTILGTFRKLTKKDQAAGLPVFGYHYLPRTTEEAEAAYTNDLLPQLLACAHQLDSRRAPRAWESCLGIYGNSPCILYNHCHSGIPVEACGLVAKDDRYAGIGPVPGQAGGDPVGA